MTQTDKSNGQRRLAVTAMGINRQGLALDLIRSVIERGCLIIDCRVVPLGQSLTVTFLIGGNWSALGRLETALPNLAEKLDIQIQYQSTEAGTQGTPDYRPYAVEVIAPSKADLVPQVLDFFHAQNVRINELATQEYLSTHTGAAMCNMSLVVHMPVSQHPQALRESFMDLCDELNADGILDPIKT